MRVVLDTNVVVSCLITTHGVCGQILDLMTDGVFEPSVDDRILAEYESVVHRPHLRILPADAEVILGLIRLDADIVSPMPLPVQLPDPADAPFLEVASATGTILVTGNRRHFPKEACKGVTVLSPREFLELLRRSS